MPEEKSTTITFHLDKKLKKEFELLCAIEDVGMGAKLQTLLSAYVAKNSTKLPPQK